MESLNLNAMEEIRGGAFWLGFAAAFAVKMMLDDDFIQGVADGIVGAPRY